MSVPLPLAEPSRLSEELSALRARLKGQGLTVGELEQALGGRGFALLLMLLSLPFCIVGVPGLSMPFGVAIALMGARIALGRKPWLPKFVLERHLPAARLEQLLKGAVRFARGLEKIARPRLFFFNGPVMRNLIGVGIAAAGLVLMLPLPIPFSNTIPAWAVVLLAAGMMEKDGLLVLLGHGIGVASWGFVTMVWLLGMKGVEKMLGGS